MDLLWPHTKILKASSIDSRDVDWISSLPDEVLSDILTVVPTKEAAVASVVSKKMRCAFNWRKSLDFDSVELPLPTPRCEIFKAFVNAVLKAFWSPYLYKFTLQFGGDKDSYIKETFPGSYIKESFPDLEPVHLNAWLHFPLTRDGGVREIDLSIHVKQSAQLPQALFTCETLVVLKLCGSLGIDDQVCAMPSFNLPNLKTFHLCCAGVFTDDSFLTKLVSSCPSLQDLEVQICLWEHGDIISISSTSLRRLYLQIERSLKLYEKCSQHVLIDAPYLEYFTFDDNLALRYSITTMNHLLEADIVIGDMWGYHPRTCEECFESLLSLLGGLSKASHLYLRGSCNEILDFFELKDDQMAVFHNLKHLELDTNWDTKWDRILLDFLKHSPFLEILCFPKGLLEEGPNGWDLNEEGLELERQAFSTPQLSSFLSHLKRIEIKYYQGYERELNLIKSFLACASVLEDLVITRSKIDPKSLETTLKELPRASSTCSIHVQEAV